MNNFGKFSQDENWFLLYSGAPRHSPTDENCLQHSIVGSIAYISLPLEGKVATRASLKLATRLTDEV